MSRAKCGTLSKKKAKCGTCTVRNTERDLTVMLLTLVLHSTISTLIVLLSDIRSSEKDRSEKKKCSKKSSLWWGGPVVSGRPVLAKPWFLALLVIMLVPSRPVVTILQPSYCLGLLVCFRFILHRDFSVWLVQNSTSVRSCNPHMANYKSWIIFST